MQRYKNSTITIPVYIFEKPCSKWVKGSVVFFNNVPYKQWARFRNSSSLLIKKKFRVNAPPLYLFTLPASFVGIKLIFKKFSQSKFFRKFL